jgi:hypothetical protein
MEGRMKKKIIDYEKIMEIARDKIELEELLIDKYYVLYNFDGLIIIKFKINYVKTEESEAIKHDDGSFSPSFTRISVSDKGFGWYGLDNSGSNNIVEEFNIKNGGG